jgi:hypothetical protein
MLFVSTHGLEGRRERGLWVNDHDDEMIMMMNDDDDGDDEDDHLSCSPSTI